MNDKIIILITSLSVFYIWENIYPYYKKSDSVFLHDISNASITLLNIVISWAVGIFMIKNILSFASTQKFGLYYFLPDKSIYSYIIIFLLFDMWMYWWHRINHKSKFLWLFHRAHHTDINMNSTTMFRFHPFELVFSTIFRVPIFLLLGMQIEVLVLHEILLNTTGYFHHSNISIPKRIDKVLRIFIVTQEIHRVHHSVERKESNSNYSSFLSIWDRIFGTLIIHSNSKKITQGLKVMRNPEWQTPMGILKSPFSKEVNK